MAGVSTDYLTATQLLKHKFGIPVVVSLVSVIIHVASVITLHATDAGDIQGTFDYITHTIWAWLFIIVGAANFVMRWACFAPGFSPVRTVYYLTALLSTTHLGMTKGIAFSAAQAVASCPDCAIVRAYSGLFIVIAIVNAIFDIKTAHLCHTGMHDLSAAHGAELHRKKE